MSQENVEIVRRVYEAAARRDAANIFALYDPDVELDATRTGVGTSAATEDMRDSAASSASSMRFGERSSTTTKS